jgi:hypothetical protein
MKNKKQEEEWTFVTHKRKKPKRGHSKMDKKTERQIAKAKALAETLCTDPNCHSKEQSFSEQDVHHLSSCVEHCMQELLHLENSIFHFKGVMNSLLKSSASENISDVVCYGIGTFSTSASSATGVTSSSPKKSNGGMNHSHAASPSIQVTSPKFYSASIIQLSCVLLIRQEVAYQQYRHKEDNSTLQHNETQTSVPFSMQQELVPMVYFEPFLQAVEREVLTQHFHVNILDENERGKRCVDRNQQLNFESESDVSLEGPCGKTSIPSPSSTTLFYMPHCPMRLYSNLLWANWKPELMLNGRLIILGNSFTAYDDRIVDSQKRRDETNAIFPSLKWVQETPVLVKSLGTNTRKNVFDRNGALSDQHLEMAFNDCVVATFVLGDQFKGTRDTFWPLRPTEFLSSSHSENYDGEVI